MRISDLVDLRDKSKTEFLGEHPGSSNFILKQDFDRRIKLYQDEARKMLLNHTKVLGFDPENPGIQAKTLSNGVRLELNVLNKNQRAAKRIFQEKAISTIVDSFYNHQIQKDKLVNEQNFVNDRITAEFLCGISSSNINLQLESFVNALKSDMPLKKKNELFAQYIEEAVNTFKNTKIPENDVEGLANFEKMYPLGYMFCVDNIDKVFNNITGQRLDPEIKANWDKNKEIYKDVWRYYGNLADKLTNPVYQFFDDKSMHDFAKQLEDNENITNYIGENLTVRGLFEPFVSLQYMKECGELVYNMKLGNFDKAKLQLNLNEENDVLFTDEGFKDREIDLANDLAEDKDIFVHRLSGEKYVISNHKTGFLNIRPVYELNDCRDVYKFTLGILNKGTRFYISSSDEYKNMRNILGQLSRGEGNELQLLKDLDKNIKKYEDNFFLKKNKSNIALERFNCVHSIKFDIQRILDSKRFSDIENRLLNENANNNNPEHNIVNEENTNLNDGKQLFLNEINEQDNQFAFDPNLVDNSLEHSNSNDGPEYLDESDMSNN